MKCCEKCYKSLELRAERLRENGLCNVCDMMQAQLAPAAKTDTSLFTGDKIGLGPIQDPGLIELYKREAIAAGVNPDAAQYFPELAEYAGDPRAWCRDRGEMKKLLEERGWGCEEGHVKVSPREPANPPPPPPRLADDIVNEIVADELIESGVEKIDMSDPKDRKLVNELKEKAIDTHGRPADVPLISDLGGELKKDLAGVSYGE